MANETKRHDASEPEEAKIGTSSENKSKFALFCSQTMRGWLTIILIGTLATFGIWFIYYKLSNTRIIADNSPEISLGDFKFTADKTSGGRVASADFSLYITALEGLDQIARTQLTSHKYRVQQEIEALLRQAHSGDFDDPNLNDVKRQIREQVNHVLGNRVVSDVIIANLKITASEIKEPAPPADTASTPPWLEKSSSYVSQQSGK